MTIPKDVREIIVDLEGDILVIAELAFSGAEAISPESVKRARGRQYRRASVVVAPSSGPH